MYKEKDLLTQQITQERELTFDYTDNHVGYLAYLTRAILSKAGSSAQFAELAPKVKEYIRKHLFDVEINIQNPEVVKKLNHMHIRERIREVFVKALNDLSKAEEEIIIASYYQISQTEPFHTSEEVYPVQKTVFNHLPVSKKSRLEKEFIRYLDEQNEALAFTKVIGHMPLRIHYYGREGVLSTYIPDFVVKTESCLYLMETKGELYEELESTKLKAETANVWCKNASKLTVTEWSYIKVTEDAFYQYRHHSLSQLIKILA